MRRLRLLPVVAMLLGMGATAGEPYYSPQGLDAPSLIQRFLADFAKPGYKFEGLAGAQVVQAQTLIFRARVDDRPLVVDLCVVGAEITQGASHEWLFMTFFRHPYGPRVGHTEWRLANLSGLHSPFAFRRIASRPTISDIEDYLSWSRWDKAAANEFKDIAYLYFPASWRSLAGSDAFELKGAVPWPPKD
jgi:hypothetical protein